MPSEPFVWTSKCKNLIYILYIHEWIFYFYFCPIAYFQNISITLILIFVWLQTEVHTKMTKRQLNVHVGINDVSFFSYFFGRMLDPSALRWFLFYFSSFPVSLSLHVKSLQELWILRHLNVMSWLFFFFSFTKCHSHGVWLFYCCWSECSIHGLQQWSVVCRTKLWNPIQSGCE